ncbi:MAG: sulfotransferase [Alphaproteobacteria bacterium]|nr:sulfotransferase [Alphaproteobacteria bacterium]
MAARPVFILSSGRSGSASLARLLGRHAEIEMHHEYLCTHLQEAGVRFYMGHADAAATRAVIDRLHGAALAYARTPLWGDSSNKLSWVAPLLVEMFPNARFVHLMRDGRKVAGSYARKLSDECYGDYETACLAAWAADPTLPAPPPEKRFWWPLPRPGHPLAERFSRFTQFERIAFHWAECNAVALDALASVPEERRLSLRLEDLRAHPRHVHGLLDFLGLTPMGDEFALLQRPFNVNRPEDRPLTPDELRRFLAIAGEMMDRLGYSERDEYVVDYA